MCVLQLTREKNSKISKVISSHKRAGISFREKFSELQKRRQINKEISLFI